MRFSTFSACTALACLLVAPATCFPSYRMEMPLGDMVPCGPGMEGCSPGMKEKGQPDLACFGLGHATCQGGTLPLNAFGQDFKAAGYKWTKEICQKDSDGDGQTNGEELGDPCCLWEKSDLPSPYMSTFVPSHPGTASHKQASATYAKPTCGTADTSPSVKAIKQASFNPGEVQKEMVWRIKNWTLPVTRTTYVNMAWNFDDDTADIFHVVFGEAIIDQPKHLHHFVVSGCTQRFPENETGLPLDSGRGVPVAGAIKSETYKSCSGGVGGFAGWAPGSTMWDAPVSAGIPIGRGVGIVAIVVNIHFTDVVEDGTVSQDGIRMFYTPNLRNKTVLATPIINIIQAPKEDLFIPQMKKRHFLTRECTVVDRCTDSTPEQIKAVLKSASRFGGGGGMSANPTPTMAVSCGLLKTLGRCGDNSMMKTLCPSSCAPESCPPDRDPSKEPPLQIIGTNFHAHLAGVEMYMTRTRGSVRTDLASQPIWYYDDQKMFPLLTQSYDLRPGDRLQATCVYDTTKGVGATGPLRFGKETIDEMCIDLIQTIHSTEDAKRTGVTTFTCSGNMWMGDLGADESGIIVDKLHPQSKATHVYRSSQLGLGDRVTNDVIANMDAKSNGDNNLGPKGTETTSAAGTFRRGVGMSASILVALATMTATLVGS